MYDHLFTKPNPDDVPEGGHFLEGLNPNSLEILPNAFVEPSLRDATLGSRYQFERNGYFCIDPDTTSEKLVFNRTVGLKDNASK